MWHTVQFGGSAEAVAKSAEVQKNVDFSWGVKIPMRDGIHLNATLYKPKSGEPTPAIFTLTPYIADSYHERAFYFARHGYAFALVDCRGRGNSEGEFEAFIHEGRDGYDIVEWLAAQPWCNASVTMWGGSYAGFDQWVALKEAPPHLRTIVPAASAHAAVDFPFYKNIFFPYEMQWLTLTSGVTGNANLFGEEAFWIEKFRELYLDHRPFKELDQVAGNISNNFQKLLQTRRWLSWRGFGWFGPYRVDLARWHHQEDLVGSRREGGRPGRHEHRPGVLRHVLLRQCGSRHGVG